MPTQTEKSLFRFAHISDLHFSKISWNPSQFFSKRWLGNLNLLFCRNQTFDPSRLTTLIPIFHEKKIDSVLITGDLSCTSHEKEFLLAKEFIDCLREQNFKVFALPGNHDQYTQRAFKKQLFYNFFPATYGSPSDLLSSLSLKEDKLTTTYLGEGWWLIGLDTAIATSWWASTGYFSAVLEQKLEMALQAIPSDHRVILINHFPLFSNESPRKSLLRSEALKKLIEGFPKIKLFLHGHSHRNCIADLRSSNLPIILDSGSPAQKEGGTWNLIDVTPSGCEIEVFKGQNVDDSTVWQSILKSHFKW